MLLHCQLLDKLNLERQMNHSRQYDTNPGVLPCGDLLLAAKLCPFPSLETDILRFESFSLVLPLAALGCTSFSFRNLGCSLFVLSSLSCNKIGATFFAMSKHVIVLQRKGRKSSNSCLIASANLSSGCIRADTGEHKTFPGKQLQGVTSRLLCSLC